MYSRDLGKVNNLVSRGKGAFLAREGSFSRGTGIPSGGASNE